LIQPFFHHVLFIFIVFIFIAVSQDYKIQNSNAFTSFFLQAQQETQSEPGVPASLDVFLMNGHKITGEF